MNANINTSPQPTATPMRSTLTIRCSTANVRRKCRVTWPPCGRIIPSTETALSVNGLTIGAGARYIGSTVLYYKNDTSTGKKNDAFSVAGYALMDATVKYDLARFGLPRDRRSASTSTTCSTANMSPVATANTPATGAPDVGSSPPPPSVSNLPTRRGSPLSPPIRLSLCRNRLRTRETTFALDRVTFRVPGRTLLHPLSLTFPTGKVTGLIGHNGSGKSTLLKMLGRHQPSRPPQAKCYWTGGRWKAGAAKPLPAKWPICRSSCRRPKV